MLFSVSVIAVANILISVGLKTVYTYIDGQERSFLFFDYVKDYYEYLMLLFYNRKETVC